MMATRKGMAICLILALVGLDALALPGAAGCAMSGTASGACCCPPGDCATPAGGEGLSAASCCEVRTPAGAPGEPMTNGMEGTVRVAPTPGPAPHPAGLLAGPAPAAPFRDAVDAAPPEPPPSCELLCRYLI